MEQIDVVIVGGGPAGLAAAVELWKSGVRSLLIVEREKQLGGILRQCIHDGFGLTRFGVSLSGPEYAQRFIDQVEQLGIPYAVNTTVARLTPDRQVTLISPGGLRTLQARAVVLAMGCRERTRGALAIPGDRPAGVFTAGVAQAYINLFNRMVGKEVVILGSGDIGMIMARRLTLEGAHVQAVFEIQPIPSGLPRNIEQCLNDYGIPLHLHHTITQIHGRERVTGVTVARVDDQLRPITGTEKKLCCDTVILSVGLLPENELSIDAGISLDSHTRGAVVDEFFQTQRPGFFAAGNALHVHDLVDFVSEEAEQLAHSVVQYLRQGMLPRCRTAVAAGRGLNHTLPHFISGERDVTLSLRVAQKVENGMLTVRQGGKVIASRKMKRAIPAEMIRLPLKREVFHGTETVEVSME